MLGDSSYIISSKDLLPSRVTRAYRSASAGPRVSSTNPFGAATTNKFIGSTYIIIICIWYQLAVLARIILLVRDRKITFYDNNLSAFYFIKYVYTNVHYNILYYYYYTVWRRMRVKCFFWHIWFASALNARSITRSRILYNCCTYARTHVQRV